MIVGLGTYRYEWIEGWAKVPDHLALGYTHAVVEDSQGRIYIHNMGQYDATVVFDPEGNCLNSWGEEYAEGAHGMLLNEEADGEYLYLSTTALNEVVKTTLEGEVVFRIGTPPRPDIYDEEKQFRPTETAVAPNGDLYIADGYGQPWIHQYSAQAEYIRSFGGPGEGEGQLSTQPWNAAHGIKIDTRGSEPLVLVCDRGNSRLQYFTLEGKFVRQVDSVLRQPCTTEQFGDKLFVVDLHSRITLLDENDQLITHLGERERGWEMEGWPNIPQAQREVGKFTSPHDLHVDGDGNVYVVEWIEDGRITKLIPA